MPGTKKPDLRETTKLYVALNLLNDMAWLLIAHGDEDLSRAAMGHVERLRATILGALQVIYEQDAKQAQPEST